MKSFSLLVGAGIVASALLGLVLFIWLTHAFTIKAILCMVEGQPCSENVQSDIETELIGKPIFLTDFASLSEITDYHVSSFQKMLPSKLVIHLAPVQPNQLKQQNTSLLFENQSVEDYLAVQLNQHSIEFQSVEVLDDQNLVSIKLNTNLQALLRLDNIVADAEKVIQVLSFAKLSEIDAGIVEIDARYDMVVLRTSKSVN